EEWGWGWGDAGVGGEGGEGGDRARRAAGLSARLPRCLSHLLGLSHPAGGGAGRGWLRAHAQCVGGRRRVRGAARLSHGARESPAPLARLEGYPAPVLCDAVPA